MVLRKSLLAILCLTFICFTGADENSFEKCGFTRCRKRDPYEFCVGPPLISEGNAPYCLKCDSRQELCGTETEQIGCKEYCQNFLKEKRSGNCTDQSDYDNSGDLAPKIYLSRKWFIAGSVTVAGLFLVLISYLICLKCKGPRDRKGRSCDDIECSSLRKGKGKESVVDIDETSLMIRKTTAENPTGGTQCLTGQQVPTGMRLSTEGNSSHDLQLRKIKANATNEDKNVKYYPC